MPGLVNDSDDEDDGEEADMVYHQTVQLSTSPSIANIKTTNNVMTNNTQDRTNIDMEFDEESIFKFINELRVAETGMTEPEYIKECPLYGLFRYPDDPNHIDIFHLHVFCNVCQRYEGAYFGIDRCDGLPTMDEQLMQSITNVNDTEQDNVVFIPKSTYRQLMTYPIGVDEISDDFLENLKEPIIMDTGSKLRVFQQYLAFTHYHPCSEPILLQ
jgi:hypothetical protein